ncbi:MAG: hypothetical protein U1U88_001919 [Lawsonella clevelandensis]
MIAFGSREQAQASRDLTIVSALSGTGIDTLVSGYKGHGYSNLKKDTAEAMTEFATWLRPCRSVSDRAELERVLQRGAERTASPRLPFWTGLRATRFLRPLR